MKVFRKKLQRGNINSHLTTQFTLTGWSTGGSIIKPVLIIKKRALLLILITAVLLRLAGISHGFPYIYHPDEPTIIRTALGLRFDPNPHHFDWPHLYVYLNYFVYMTFLKLRDSLTFLGLRPFLSGVMPVIYNEDLIYYLLTRILSASLGAVTVIPIYLWAKKLFSKRVGIISAALLSVAPLHVRNSHYALIDIPMMFFLSWALYFSTTSPILSGLFLGFSASTKYNGILGVPVIFAYYLITKKKFRSYIKTGFFTLIGFVLGTPFSVLDFKTFIRTDGPKGALWQFTNVGKVGIISRIHHFFETLFSTYPQSLGYLAVFVFFIGCVILIKQMRAKQLNKFFALCALSFLILTFYISGLDKNRSHYYIAAYPYFFLATGWTVDKLLYLLKNHVYKAVFLILLFSVSLIASIQNIRDLQTRVGEKVYGGVTVIKPKDKTYETN